MFLLGKICSIHYSPKFGTFLCFSRERRAWPSVYKICICKQPTERAVTKLSEVFRLHICQTISTKSFLKNLFIFYDNVSKLIH